MLSPFRSGAVSDASVSPKTQSKTSPRDPKLVGALPAPLSAYEPELRVLGAARSPLPAPLWLQMSPVLGVKTQGLGKSWRMLGALDKEEAEPQGLQRSTHSQLGEVAVPCTAAPFLSGFYLN